MSLTSTTLTSGHKTFGIDLSPSVSAGDFPSLQPIPPRRPRDSVMKWFLFLAHFTCLQYESRQPGQDLTSPESFSWEVESTKVNV